MRKAHTMKWTFILAIVLPGSILGLLLASTLTFGLLLASTGESIYQNLLLIVDFALIFIYVFVAIFEVRYLHEIYQVGLYRISRGNLEKLSRGDPDLRAYPTSNVVEMEDLNKSLLKLSERWRSSVLYSAVVDYEALGVEFLDKAHHLVSYGYLQDHLANLVHASGAFTVGLLCLHYEFGIDRLNDEEYEHLLTLADENFSFIKGRLFAKGTDSKSLYCYLPGIDSMRIVKERIGSMVSEVTVSKRAPGGLSLYPLKGAMVCYPHSSVDDMLSDLRYARRQTAPIYVFLPDRRRNNGKGITLSEHPDSVAFFNKVLLPIRHLTGKGGKEKETIRAVFEAVGDHVGSDFRDLILLEQNTRRYYSYLTDKAIDNGNELIAKLLEIIDEDNSFYFSSRSSCSLIIARKVDELGISSGYLYALYNGGECIGCFYYGRHEGEMILDTYLKEALLRLGEALTDYFFLLEKEDRARAFQAQSEHIMGLSNYMLYRIDDATMNLTYFSPNMRPLFPNLKLGTPCYKALYGIDRMCPSCPMRLLAKMKSEKSAKMQGKVKDVMLETSLTVNDRQSHERTLLVERVNDEKNHDPYDRDWLVYSYHSLIQQLENVYMLHSRGYLLMLCLDNVETFLGLEGSEGTSFSIRSFIRRIKQEINSQDVFAYDPACVAILLPRLGHVEMIDICEKIYDLSKEQFLQNGDKGGQFSVTYLPLGYPRGYSSAMEFLSHVEESYHNRAFARNKDFIYLQDHGISRSASRNIHMLEVIDEVFGTKTASCVYLQPMLTAGDKKIMGAEMLLRVEDTIRHNFFRADELSDIAVKNGRTSLITESLLNFVGELYKEHGRSIFALNNFRRISINVDAAFLTDTNLSKKVHDLYEEQHLDKDFLAFEVPENLIGGDFKTEGNAFANSGAVLVCDRYTGKYVSMDKLKKYGFREIKLPRELINGIEVDAQKLAAVASIVSNAKELGLKVSVVGVENSDQFIALRDLDPTMLVQGYHFYKPLSRSELITAIVSHNH